MDTALVVDNNKKHIAKIVKIIKSIRKGMKIQSTFTAKTALAIAKKTVPDIAFISQELPDMAGIELIQTMKQKYITTYNILVLPLDHKLTLDPKLLQEIDDIIYYPETEACVKNIEIAMNRYKKYKEINVKEHTLREREERYRSMFDISPISITMIDTNGKIIDCNKVTEKITGYSKKDIVGKPFNQLLTLDPKDLPDMKNIFRSLLKGKKIDPFSLEITRKDGKKRWVKADFSLIFENNEVEGIQIISEDITDQKQAEEDLKKLSSVVEQSARSIAIVDIMGNIEYINSKLLEVYQCKRADVIGKNWRTFISKHSTLRDQMQEIADTVLNKGEAWKGEVSDKNYKGETIWREAIIYPIKDANNTITHAIYSSEDITDRKFAEDKLQASEEKYRNVIEQSTEGLILIDEEGMVIEWNKAQEIMTGLKRDNVLGKPMWDILHFMVPDAFKPQRDKSMLKTMLQHGLTSGDAPWMNQPTERKFQHSDGSLRMVESMIFPINTSKGIMFGSVNRDITDRKNAEVALKDSQENLQTLFDSMEDFIFVLDLQGSILKVNPIVLKRLGYQESELIGKNVLKVHPKDKHKEATQIIGEMIKGNKESCPVPLITKKGKLIPVETRVTKSKWGDDDVLFGVSRDITERLLSEANLKENEEKWRSLVENSPDSILIVDKDSKILFINWVTSGVKIKDVIGKTVYDFTQPEDHEIIKKKINKVFQTGKPETYDTVAVGRNSSKAWYSTRVVPIKHENKVVSAILVSTDITERKQAEQTIRVSEEKYRTLINNIPDVTWTTDRKGNTIFVSPNVKQICGYTSEEIYNAGDKLWFGRIHPEDVKTVKKAFNTLFKKGTPLDVEYRVQRKDGKWIWLQDRSIGTYEKDGVTYADGVFSDITDRKEAEDALQTSEEKYRDIVENINDVIYKVGIDGTISYVSPTIKSILGYTPDEVVGQEFKNYVYKEDLERLMKNVQSIFAGVSTGDEYRIVSKSGEIRWIRTSSRPLIDNGKIIGLQGTMSDITDRTLAEDAINEGEEKYRLITENTSDFITMTDNVGKFIYVSPSLKRLGYKPEDLIGTIGEHLIHPDDLPEINKKLLSFYDFPDAKITVKKKEIDSQIMVEYRVRDKWGNYLNLESTVNPVFNEKGNIEKLIYITKDITEKKQTENALRISEEKFSKFFELSPIVMMVVDKETGERIELNKAYEEITGYKREETKGKSLFDFDLIIDKEKLIEGFKKLTKGKQEQNYEARIRRKDGSIRTLLYSGEPMEVEGRELVLITGQDITDRKLAEDALRESEEKYRHLVENSNDLIMLTQSDGKIAYLSPACEAVLGHKPESLIGKQPWIIHPDDLEKVQKAHYEALNGTGDNNFEYRIITKKGDEKWILHSWSPIMNGKKLQLIVSVIKDITERKRAQESLKYRLEFEQLVAEISTNFINLESDEIDEGINNALVQIGRFTDVDRSYIFLMKKDGKMMSNTHEWCNKGIKSQMDMLQGVDMDSFKWVTHNLLNKKILNVPDVEKLPKKASNFKDSLEAGQVQSILSLPIIVGGKILGFIGFDSVRKKRDWSEDTVTMMKMVAEIFANTLERNRTEKALMESEEKFRNIVQSSPMGMHMYNLEPDGSLIFAEANPAADKILGVDHTQFVGKKLEDAFPSAKNTEIPKKYREAARAGNDWSTEQVIYEDQQVSGAFEVHAFQTSPGRMVASFLEITDRKKAELAVKESEEKYRSLVESAKEAILTADSNGNIISWNRGAEEMLGYKAREVTGKPIFKIIPKNLYKFEKKMMNKTRKIGFVEGYESKVVAKNGTVIPVELSLSSIKDEKGKVIGFSSIVRNISERKKAEEVIRESEEKFRTFFENEPEYCYMVSHDGKIMDINKSALNILGYKKNDLIGKPIDSIYSPEMLEKMKNLFTEWKKTGELENEEMIIITKNGERRYVLLSASMMKDQNGKILHSISVQRDITERKQAQEALEVSEDRYRKVSELISDFVYSIRVEPDGSQVSEWSTETLKRVIGMDYNDLLIRGGWQKIIHPEDLMIVAERAKALAEGRSDISEYRVIAKNDEVRWVRDYGYPIWDNAEGRIVRIYGAAQDITERKRAEEALKEGEEKFRTLFELSPYSTVLSDLEGNIVECNQQFAQLHSTKQDPEALIGQNVKKYFPKKEWPALFSTIQKTIKTDAAQGPTEYMMLKEDGTLFSAETVSTLIKDPDGKPISLLAIAHDITQRKKAEEELKTSRERFHDIVNLLPEGVFEIDTKGILTYANQRAFEMAGYSQNTIDEGMNAMDLFVPSDHKRVMENMKRVLKGEHLGINEYTAITKDGSIYPVLIHSAAIYQDGKPVGARGIIMNISDRKQAEEALKQSEERLRSTFESSPDAITVTDLNGNIYQCNEQTVLLYGAKTKDEIIGKNSFDFVSKKDHKRAKENLKKILEYGIGKNIEYTFITKNGREYPAELSASVIYNSLKRPIGFIGIIKDITDRKLLETKLRRKLKESENLYQLSEGLKYSDNLESVSKKGLFSICSGFNFPRGLFFLFDEKGETLTLAESIGFGQKKPEITLNIKQKNNIISQTVNKKGLNIIRNGILDSDGTNVKIPKKLTSNFGFPNRKGDYIVTPISSKKRIIGVLVLELKYPDNFSKEDRDMLAMYLTTVGIAIENVQLYHQLDSSYRNLKAIDRMRTEFIDVASHELRTPLASIKIYTDLMRKGYIGEFSQDEISQLNDMNINIIDLNNLISDMLDFSRTEHDFTKLKLKKISMSEIADEVVDGFRELAKTRKIKINIKHVGKTSTTSDYQMVRKVFTNLISNAIKYSHDGEKVEIKVMEEGDHALISVKDTGIGISAKDLPHIFKRFYMGDTSLTREKDQLGLGLSIAKSIVERHGGMIWAESKVGKGSKFSFTIPKQPTKQSQI
jgi:PAS domain S-box-containing protein